MELIINCDGGSRGNPGFAAIGVIIRDGERVLEKFSGKIGKTTNNVAEYHALIKALELAARFTKENIKVIMDSELVVKQVKGEYSVRAKHLLPLFLEVRAREKIFKKVSYENVPREDSFQSEADKLVNLALDS